MDATAGILAAAPARRRAPPDLPGLGAADRPGYGASQLPAGGFVANARAVLDDLDARGITRAVLVGHSYGGGVALSAAALAPRRVEAVILLARVGPGCVNGWDKLLAAPGTGQLCALVAWRLTPWMARARLARIARRRGRPLRPDEHVNWQVWGHPGRGHHPLWRTFLAEQRALLRELDELEHAISSVQVPVLLLADPRDTLVPLDTARWIARALPMPACSSSRAPVITCPGEPPMPSPTRSRRSSSRPKKQITGSRGAAAPSEGGVALRQPSFSPIRWRSLVLQTCTAVADDASPAGAPRTRSIQAAPVLAEFTIAGACSNVWAPARQTPHRSEAPSS